jgi:hypothetical protein
MTDNGAIVHYRRMVLIIDQFLLGVAALFSYGRASSVTGINNKSANVDGRLNSSW